jgi:hypothetical protein
VAAALTAAWAALFSQKNAAAASNKTMSRTTIKRYPPRRLGAAFVDVIDMAGTIPKGLGE